MRAIGVLGGMSWESTSLFYRELNELVRERLGGLHSARIYLSSVDFAGIEELQRADDWERAGAELAAEARALERAGAEFLVLCTNTMHIVADTIAAAVDIPFLHLGDVTGDAVHCAGLGTVGLLGTRFTMERSFYADRIRSHGIDVLVPDAEQRDVVHRIIYEELVLGTVKAESRTAYQRVIDSLVERGAEGVILGCTEVELLIGPEHSPVPVFPTTRLQVEAAVAHALA